MADTADFIRSYGLETDEPALQPEYLEWCHRVMSGQVQPTSEQIRELASNMYLMGIDVIEAKLLGKVGAHHPAFV